MKRQQLRFPLPGGREYIVDVVPAGGTPPTMDQILHDCPECRAALERGETPTIFSGHEVSEQIDLDRPESRQVRRARLRKLRRSRY